MVSPPNAPVWETSTGKLRKVVPGAPGAMSAIFFAIASDGRQVAGDGPDLDVAAFDIATGEAVLAHEVQISYGLP